MSDSEFDAVLDARGLFCPEPVMLLHKKMRDIEAGQILKVIATDATTQRDVPKFCHFLGHELLEEVLKEKDYYYFIRKST